MPIVAGIVILLVLGVSLGLGLLLVYFVRRESPSESGLDWDSAERVARKDGVARKNEGGDDRQTDPDDTG